MGNATCCCEAETDMPTHQAVVDSHVAGVGRPRPQMVAEDPLDLGQDYVDVTTHEPERENKDGGEVVAEQKATESAPPEPTAVEAKDEASYIAAAPATEEEPASKLDDGIFEVELQNDGSKKLGFGVGYKPGERHLHVVKLLAAGLIPDWNEENPDKKIEVGYQLLSVNDTSIEPHSQDVMTKTIIEACKAPVLKFVVKKMPLVN
mmetsp:Transcript_17754/g.41327  ORF Transcript_17754/g.41327 Transcript_17754/m.41327 type:complete len:205 (-) Transcript_17754:101-715(-)